MSRRSGEEDLKIGQCIFTVCNSLPFEKGLDLHIKKLNPMFCAKFGWKCPNGSGEENFKKFSIMYVFYFAIISNLRRAWPFNCRKCESSSPKDALCQVWLKLDQLFWRRRWKSEKLVTDRQSKICRLSYEMDRIGLFRIILWRNKIHLVKFYKFSFIQEYY